MPQMRIEPNDILDLASLTESGDYLSDQIMGLDHNRYKVKPLSYEVVLRTDLL